MQGEHDQKVVPLKRLPRLHPDEVLVLSLYRTRRDALGPRSRDALAYLEALLFQDGLRSAQKARAAFPADVSFPTPDGIIYHAWCPVRGRHTLCDFELPRQGGGQRCERAGVLGRCTAALAAQTRRAGRFSSVVMSELLSILAGVASLLGLDRISRPDQGLVGRLFSPQLYVANERMREFFSGGERESIDRRVDELLRYSHHLAAHAPPSLPLHAVFALIGPKSDPWGFAAAHAAEWSLLGSAATVAEELESSFSRSILRGEYLCQIGYAADGADHYAQLGRASANLRLGAFGFVLRGLSRRRLRIREQARRLRLFQEVSLLVSSLHKRHRVTDRACMFLTGDFPMRDLAADDRLLALVRSELVMRVSSRVFIDCVDPSRFAVVDDAPALDGSTRAAAFRHFALVAELSRLATHAFGGPAVADIAAAVIADYAASGRRRRRLESIVLNIAGYEQWLATALPEIADSQRSATDLVNSGERISAIVGELLGVSTSQMMPRVAHHRASTGKWHSIENP
ncbi:MAG TPA: hypothetical protein VGB79_09520 [Allosphingosinicella sp.]|jgi:hypothetical protein